MTGQTRFRSLGATLTALALGLVLLALGCSSRVAPHPSGPRPTAKGTYRPYSIAGRTYYPLRRADGFQENGLASWYGPNFHGKRTANGEVYNMEAMTAAHKTLPMNTYVRVYNQRNGRNAVVRINDRGPFVSGRVIDLSRAAARKLGVIGTGTAPVRVVALGFREPGSGLAGRPPVYRQPPSYQVGDFSVQVGAFTNPANAQRLAARLRKQWPVVRVVRYDRGDAIFHRVRVGQVRTLQESRNLEIRLQAAGFAQAMSVAN